MQKMLKKNQKTDQGKKIHHFFSGPTGKLAWVLFALFIFLAIPQKNKTAKLSMVKNDLTLSENFYELHIFPEEKMLDLNTGSFEEAVTMLDFFLAYSDLYKIKIALPENYQLIDDLRLFLISFVNEEIEFDFIEYPEKDYADGGFVLWTDSKSTFNEKLSIKKSMENLKEEEYRLLESTWLTAAQKTKSPVSSIQNGWIFIEHPYRNPKEEFLLMDNVSFMELDMGVDVDFLKKNKQVWKGSIKPSALRLIIGSFCFSFCNDDEVMPNLPIVIKITNGMTTHWSSGYPQQGWLNR